MTTLLAIILILALGGGVVSFSIRAAWGILKFLLGLVIFCIFPVVLVFALIVGTFAYVVLPVALVGGLLYLVFKKA